MSVENMETKEDIKKVIDKSTDYGELYKISLEVLKRMESTFKDTLKWIANREWWDWQKKNTIDKSIFDNRLNTNNPVTIFEKKWAELLKRSKDIAENNMILNKWIQLAKSLWIKRLDQRWKDVIINELFKTRQDAIQDFKIDASDGMLSNKNNIDISQMKEMWSDFWKSIFWWKEDYSKEEFANKIENLSLQQLIYWTFNINGGSWAFNYCFKQIKERLWNKNLFDYIDSINKKWDQTAEFLKYSSIKMLMYRWEITDLIKRIDGYKWNKELLNYIRIKTLKDEDFKIWFLGSIKKLENNEAFEWFFKNLARDLKKDSKVAEAYRRASRVDNVDIFTPWKNIEALTIYDDEEHWGAWFFESDLAWYKNRWFQVSEQVNNSNYEKYILKKGNDTVTMIQMKDVRQKDNHICWLEGGEGEERLLKYKAWEIANILKPIVSGKNYNLFALRWHCYNTEKFSYSLWHLNAVDKDDIFIDWWCWNAKRTWLYYKFWIKGHTFAYTVEGRWNSTKSFIDKIFDAKSKWENFSTVLWYYNGLRDESWVDWYFACNVEKPDSVASQYKRLKQ